MATRLYASHLVTGTAIRLSPNRDWLVWPNSPGNTELFHLPDLLLHQNLTLFHQTDQERYFSILEETPGNLKLKDILLEPASKKVPELAKMKLVNPGTPAAPKSSKLILEVRRGSYRYQYWTSDSGRPLGWTSFWTFENHQQINPGAWIAPNSSERRTLEKLEIEVRALAQHGLTL